MTKFQIWTRRSNEAEWTLYGEFKSEQEFRREIPHIRAQGLATKRKVVA